MHHKATKQAKSTPTAYQKAIKTSQKPQNGLGLLSKTHTLTPPRQAISLLALAATGVRTYATTPKQKAKPHRAPRTRHLASHTLRICSCQDSYKHNPGYRRIAPLRLIF